MAHNCQIMPKNNYGAFGTVKVHGLKHKIWTSSPFQIPYIIMISRKDFRLEACNHQQWACSVPRNISWHNNGYSNFQLFFNKLVFLQGSQHNMSWHNRSYSNFQFFYTNLPFQLQEMILHLDLVEGWQRLPAYLQKHHQFRCLQNIRVHKRVLGTGKRG